MTVEHLLSKYNKQIYKHGQLSHILQEELHISCTVRCPLNSRINRYYMGHTIKTGDIKVNDMGETFAIDEAICTIYI